MVTSPHYLASEAGLKVLEAGGNAIEAAVAIAATLSVTYPHFCGLGGDAVWLVAEPGGAATCFLGIGQAGQGTGPGGPPIPTRGAGSTVTTACAVDSWGHALGYSQARWGGSLSLSRLLDPAIATAESGFPVTDSQLFWLDFRKGEIAGWPGFADLFAAEAASRKGATFRQPALAKTLGAIADSGTREFYEGELASRLASGLAQAGSPLTAADLAATRTREAAPAQLDYRGLTLLAPPPPTQGVTTLMIMGILAALDRQGVAEGSADFYHFAVEAVKQAFLDRSGIADPDFAGQPVEKCLSAGHLLQRAEAIDKQRALAWPQPFRTGDTVFFAATDAAGRGVSVLQSIYFDWGSGVVAGDTGVLWQNRGAAFSTTPGDINEIRPGKRPFYTLNPGMALADGRPHLLYGTQGADGQPQTLSVVLSRLIDYGMSPLEALSAPRFLLGRTFSDSRDSLKLEEDAGAAVLAELGARGHEASAIQAHSPLAGQAGIIRIAANGELRGAHDPRSDGLALGR